MIKLELRNQTGQLIVGSVDYDKPEQPFKAEGEELAVLAIAAYSYQPGDQLVVTTEEQDNYLVVQLEETLAPSIIYLSQKSWSYKIPLTDQLRNSAIATSFSSKQHHIMVRKAYDFEIRSYQNLSFNAHDQKEPSGAYPHASANVETRNESVFFAKNAIDGKYGNVSHGPYPFSSWGINQQEDAALTIDFGRKVKINWVRFLFRGDYPHDSYWVEATLQFSDGTELIVPTTKTLDFQEIRFPEKETEKVVFCKLKKAQDDSPFPALTQIEVFGENVLD